MRFSKCIILLMVLTAALMPWEPAAAASRYRIEGNSIISDGEIEAFLKQAGDRPLEDAIARLQGAYYKRGYLFAVISVRSGEDSTLMTIDIAEGSPASFGRVTVSGAVQMDKSRILSVLGAEPGDLFRPERLERGMDQLLREYDEAGYPFIQVWLDSLRIDHASNTVDVAFFMADGGQKRFGKIVFEGLRKTREDVALKLSGLRIGEVYSGGRLTGAARRLRALGVFTRVGTPQIALAPDGTGVELRIRVEEPMRTNTFQIALGYAKEEGSRPRVFSGLASLEFKNLGGSLKDLRVFWQNDGAERSETNIFFNDRLFMGRSLGIGASLEQIGFDTLYTWQSAGVEVTVPLGAAGKQVWAVTVSVNGDRNVFSVGDLKRSWRLRTAAGLSWRWGGEESRVSLQFDGRAAYARKKQYRRTVNGDETISQFISMVAVRTGIAIGIARLHNETSYRGIESDETSLPLSEQFYLGGAGSLRGYRENQFHGKRVALARTELRFGGSARENAYLFVDGGYVLDSREGETVETRDLIRAGYGFGLRTISRVGDVDLSFGVGEKLSLQQTKVHVILGHRF